MKIIVLFCITFFVLVFHLAYGQIDITSTTNTIPITYSSSMKDVAFDGKWTFTREWKESSLVGFSGGYIRTAHFGNYIYVMIDAISRTSFEKNSDRATVCLDAKNEKASIPDSNDYCFIVTLGGKNPISVQGIGYTSLNNFKRVSSPNGLLAVGGISDQNDRYTPIPHQTYEFRIPIDLVGRSDKYGFYVSLFDSTHNKFYSWPDTTSESQLKIPDPNTWGEIISPDRSLPEFPFPLFGLVISFLVILYFTRFKKNKLR